MIKLNINHGIDEAGLRKRAALISEYLKKIEGRGQGFYKVIDQDFDGKVEGDFDDVVILGIGGSALGAICLRDALKPNARLHVLDNIDPSFIKDIEGRMNLKKTLFVVISKSGNTVEIISQYKYFKNRGAEHFVFVTDSGKCELEDIAAKESIKVFDIPVNVGGRFSVLTAVGLLPAGLMGIDTHELLRGARSMRNKFLSKEFEENMPFQLAAIQHLMGDSGKQIHVIMPYSQRLRRFADWYGQLLAESIGKEGKGLTPVSALGVTDQHSQLQLYSDGPDDKFFIFIEVKDLGAELQIPGGPTFNKLMEAEMKGTIQSLSERGRPSITITIDRVKEETLGELFLLFMGATAFLGEFYGVNAFDQPGVERSKELARKILG